MEAVSGQAISLSPSGATMSRASSVPAMTVWLQAEGLQVWAHQQLFTCVCLKLGGKKEGKRKEQEKMSILISQ